MRGVKPGPHECWRAFKFWIVFLLAAGFLIGSFNFIFRVAEPLFPLLVFMGDLPPALLYILGPFVFLSLYDFFNYWMHRAQHRWFWKQHRIHHSITHLSALNSYFHPTEHLFRIIMIYAPLYFLFGRVAAGWTVAAAMLNAMQGYYVHSPIRWDHGPFKHVLVNNAFHRVHHSVEQRHFEKNFGAFTPLWDWLFGTAYFPSKDEWPETGVWDFGEPETVGDYVLMSDIIRVRENSRFGV